MIVIVFVRGGILQVALILKIEASWYPNCGSTAHFHTVPTPNNIITISVDLL
jgi:hypothetical protein